MSQKKKFRYREPVGESFCGFTLYNREHFVFREPIGDALSPHLEWRLKGHSLPLPLCHPDWNCCTQKPTDLINKAYKHVKLNYGPLRKPK